jgi:hypothetical protein
MASKGAFGYIIGKKKRLMKVEKDADLLWQILVREIYILMKHFNTKEEMKNEFEKIKTIKGVPKEKDIEKFRIFTNLENQEQNQPKSVWLDILHFCQCSFINILEAGYILNDYEEKGDIFLLDFNKGTANYYTKDFEGKVQKNQTATLEEIMNYEEMPIKSYQEIVSRMKTNFAEFYEKYSKIEEELKNLKKLKLVAKNQNATNIEDKVNKLIDNMIWEKKKLNSTRRVFYQRLKDLDLIEE